MTILQKASLACTICCTTFAVAADTSKTIVPDNVISCQSSSCVNETRHGQTFKVLATSRFTVMVSLSDTGDYTRADVSISNNTGLPLNVTPDDFRVEVLGNKPKVLLYVAPSDRKDPPLPLPAGQTATAPKPAAATTPAPAPAAAQTPAAAVPALSPLLSPEEVAEMTAAQKDLPATSLAPNQVLVGRVYFEGDKRSPHDKKAHQVKVVFPLAGEVFEFPYNIKPDVIPATR
jgi:hypothetical protein